MAIKTSDIQPGCVVKTTHPKSQLKWGGGPDLEVMGADASWLNGSCMLPEGTYLRVKSKPKRKQPIAGKIVELETLDGQQFTAFLSYFKPRVEKVDEHGA